MTSSVVGLRRNCIVHPKVKLATKKGRGHCWVVCCLSDPLQLSESCWNHYIWEVCSAYQWDAPKTSALIVSSGQQNGHSSFPWQRPTACCTPNTSKIEQIGLQSFGSSAMFCWPLANQQEAENAFQEFIRFQSMDFYAIGINIFLIGKLLIVIVPILIHKDIFEPRIGLPGGSDSKESACNAGYPGLIADLGRSSGKGNAYPLHYFCLENFMDRGAHGVAKNLTRLCK